MWDEEEKRLLVSLPKTCYKVGKVQHTFSPVLWIRDDFFRIRILLSVGSGSGSCFGFYRDFFYY
jgi:hypothetical protein